MTNINEEYIQEYIRGVLPERDKLLRELELYAKQYHVPIIEPEVAQFLRIQLNILRPKKILEIGTAIGYSSLVMAEILEDCKITSIEKDEDMFVLANNNIDRSPYKDKINIIWGDAVEVLPFLEQKYDLIFIDAAKGQYIEFLKWAMKLLNPAGLIISDNVLYKGMVASDRLVNRRKITIVKRLREFLKYINKIDGYISSIVPIGDGVALTYKEEKF